jgi:hypothetical protein
LIGYGAAASRILPTAIAVDAILENFNDLKVGLAEDGSVYG